MSEEKREELAAYAHEAWSGWMKYQFSKGYELFDESGKAIGWVMPKDSFDRWRRQMNTPYADLPESEKASDRDEADKMLAIIKEAS